VRRALPGFGKGAVAIGSFTYIADLSVRVRNSRGK
jgi:hypothetical protein